MKDVCADSDVLLLEFLRPSLFFKLPKMPLERSMMKEEWEVGVLLLQNICVEETATVTDMFKRVLRSLGQAVLHATTGSGSLKQQSLVCAGRLSLEGAIQNLMVPKVVYHFTSIDPNSMALPPGAKEKLAASRQGKSASQCISGSRNITRYVDFVC